MRAWRAANPIAAICLRLRQRAKKKGLEFNLTSEWLEWFLREQKYDSSLHHIDRISAGRGYVMDNLQVLSIGDNIAKGNRERHGQLQCL